MMVAYLCITSRQALVSVWCCWMADCSSWHDCSL